MIFFGLAIVANLIQELLIGRMLWLRTMAWVCPIIELLFITTVIHFTGGYDSIFGFVYLVPIISASVLLSLEKGIVLSFLSTVLFSALVMFEMKGILPAHPVIGEMAYARIDSAYLIMTILFNRFLVFFIVAAVSGYLAESLKHKMKEAERMKNEFVSLVSHQLKTPLSVFKLYLEELLSKRLGKLTKDQKDYLEEMEQNNENLIWLVSDLLDISRMESGKIQYEPESTKLDQLIPNAIARLKGVSESNKCVVKFDNQVKKVPAVFVDPNKLEQAIGNFISNGIKYSTKEKGSGEIVVELKKVRTREIKQMRKNIPYKSREAVIDLFDGFRPTIFKKRKNKNFLLVSVRDNGVGIPEADQEKIFSKFYRGSNVSVYHTEGTGLGMFISRVIITGCGGEVWFDSEEGQGTTFYFTIPIERTGNKKKAKKK